VIDAWSTPSAVLKTAACVLVRPARRLHYAIERQVVDHDDPAHLDSLTFSTDAVPAFHRLNACPPPDRQATSDIGREDEVDDALQSALMQLFRRRGELGVLPADELRAYACTVASGTAIDFARRRKLTNALLVPFEGHPIRLKIGPEDAFEAEARPRDAR